MKERVK